MESSIFITQINIFFELILVTFALVHILACLSDLPADRRADRPACRQAGCVLYA